jgi:uracil-DNA glycosylase
LRADGVRVATVPHVVSLNKLLVQVRACTVCAEYLPHGTRPIVQLAATAPIVIIGQAPGRRVHESGVPWDDPSGNRLRSWLDLTPEQFYDPTQVAILPMGFCYPGSASSGDLPPRPECAPLWHEQLLEHLPANRLEVIIGTYAQKKYIAAPGKNLTETVSNWQQYLPGQIVMPHPSPRNQAWFKRNPWFETDAIPAVQDRVREVLADSHD